MMNRCLSGLSSSLTVVLFSAGMVAAESGALFASGFEAGEPGPVSSVFKRVADPLGRQGQVVVGEVEEENKQRLFKVPYADLNEDVVSVRFKARGDDGVRAAVVLNANGGRRERLLLIEGLTAEWKEYRASAKVTGSGVIEIVAPSSWGAPAGKAYLDDVDVRVERAPAPAVQTVSSRKSDDDRPNILFLTMDDMNYDSIESYGSKIKGLTPHMDSLAELGTRFEYAYVQTPSCTPSRNVFHTGHYSHNSGVQGFFSVDFPQDTLPEALRGNGYYTGIILKVIDSTPTNDTDKYWDFVANYPMDRARSPASFRDSFSRLLDGAKAEGKPFYANVNVKDPHLPFYRGEKTKDKFDKTPPSRILEQHEITIPGFLPRHESFREEVTDYYNTVRRGDDCVGEVLRVLEESGLRDNTLIIFLSDHGMSFPFAKSNLYPNGIRTPWIVVWPGKVDPGVLDSKHMVSSIDLMPTVLEATGTPAPGPLAGRSLLPLLDGERQEGWEHVFVEHNEGPGADPRPMRAIHTKDYVYIFNAWGTGDYHAIFESRWWRSYATFADLARRGPEVPEAKERFDFLMYRTVEELYDVRKDPYALNNLIDDPRYADVANELQAKLQTWMEDTNDYALEGFLVRDDIEKLRGFMDETIAESKERSLRLEWKRWQKQFEDAGRPKGKLTELGPANLVY